MIIISGERDKHFVNLIEEKVGKFIAKETISNYTITFPW
jgi:hypothetical protein